MDYTFLTRLEAFEFYTQRLRLGFVASEPRQNDSGEFGAPDWNWHVTVNAPATTTQPQEICSCCGTPINAADHAHKYAGYDGRTLETVFTHWCGAILGEATADDICASIYIPQWDMGEQLPENQRYFDLMVLPRDGAPSWVGRERSHGWFDIQSRKITQVG